MSMIQTEPLSVAWPSAGVLQSAMYNGPCADSTTSHCTRCPRCQHKFECPQLSPQCQSNFGGVAGSIPQPSASLQSIFGGGAPLQQPMGLQQSIFGGGATIQQPMGLQQSIFGGGGEISQQLKLQQSTIFSGGTVVTTQSIPLNVGQNIVVRTTQCQQMVPQCSHNSPCLQNQNAVPSLSVTTQVCSQPLPGSHLLVKNSSFHARPKRTTFRSQLSGGGIVSNISTSGDGSPISPVPSPQSTPVDQIIFEMPTFSIDTSINLINQPFNEKQPLHQHHLQPSPLDTILVPVKPAQPVPEKELHSLQNNLRALRESGWYYEGVSHLESHELLRDTKVGTFLVRNSSDPQFLFTLSVQTDRGPTSVRLQYTNGYFRLDAQPHLQTAMRAFPSVIELIEYYVYMFKFSFLRDSKEHVWVDSYGKWYSSIKLEEPLRKREEPPSLKHLARMAIHKSIRSSGTIRIPQMSEPHTKLELPKKLVEYLSEYPHSI